MRRKEEGFDRLYTFSNMLFVVTGISGLAAVAIAAVVLYTCLAYVGIIVR